MKKVLDNFFYPKSIAVVGASRKKERLGYGLWQNLTGHSYQGALYPVNPKYKKLGSHTCYGRLGELPEVPELVVITTPPETIPNLIKQCGGLNIRAVLILSAGFRELEHERSPLYDKVIQTAREKRVRILGPDSLGLQTPEIGLHAAFTPSLPQAGKVAFIAQSGPLGSAIIDWAVEKNVGFSHFVSTGSTGDLSFAELIDYFGSDTRTSCILIYMEYLTNARAFISAARAFSRTKPIVVLRAGRSPEGFAAAAWSEEGLRGQDEAYNAAFQRAGVIRVNTIQQLFDCATALATQTLPKGSRLAIVTNAGGPAILATDTLIKRHGSLSTLSEESVEYLQKQLSPNKLPVNPIDLLGDANPEEYKAAIHACLFDPNVDAVLVILTVQNPTQPDEIARILVEESKMVFGKPVYASWMGLKSVRKGRSILAKGRIPWYPFPERAVTTFMHTVHYRENLDMLFETPSGSPLDSTEQNKSVAGNLIRKALNAKQERLDQESTAEILQLYSIITSKGSKTGDIEKEFPVDFVLGMRKDPVFGPVIYFGFGGIGGLTGPSRVSGLPPLNRSLSGHMIGRTALKRLETKYPGWNSKERLEEVLVQVSNLVMDFPEIKAVQINSLVLTKDELSLRSANLTLEPKPERSIIPFSHLSIEPYPDKWIRKTQLRDGLPVTLRPIRPEDEPMEAQLVKDSSRESLYFRFFGYIPGIDHKMLSRFTHIDYDREMAIVAVIIEDGIEKIIGVVRIVGDGWRERAEYAILIADPWHGKGLGSILTDYIIEIAKEQGYREITASFLKTNGAMRRLFKRKHFRIRAGKEESDFASLRLNADNKGQA